MNDSEKELQFLQIIRVSGNMYHLLINGWTNADIIKALNYYVNNDIVKVNEKGTYLTAIGNKYFNRICKSLEKKGVSRYLTSDIEHRILPLSKDSIYLPPEITARKIEPVRSFSYCESRRSMSHRPSVE